MSQIEFKKINETALSVAVQLLSEWLPEGRIEGKEYVALNPTRKDSSPGSFKVNVETGKWGDFAVDAGGGDFISLYAYLNDISQPEAARQLAERVGALLPARDNNTEKIKKGKPVWKPILPIPDDAGKAEPHSKLGIPSETWVYRDIEGRRLGLVCRFDLLPDGGKEYRPLCYCENIANGTRRWCWKGFSEPRPLYGLDRLHARPRAPVIVTEGEKTADAAAILFPDFVAITSPNGSKAARKADWSVLSGRRVTIAPDNDKPGRKYVDEVARLVMAAGAVSVELLQWPTNLIVNEGRIIERSGDPPDGWDLVDALAEGWTPELIKKHIAEGNKILFKYTPQEKPYITDGLPSGFKLTEAGVFAMEETKDGDIIWRWICSPLEISALTRDSESDNWGRLLVFEDPDGVEHEWAMPSELLAGDGTDYRRELHRLGLDIAPDRKARNHLLSYLSSACPKTRVRCVSRTGWHKKIFVLPDTIIGPEGMEKTLLQTRTVGNTFFKKCGCLEDWKNKIAAKCIGNSRLIFAISAAFAAPLLALFDEESGGFHFRGPSSTGKTTLLRIAGSVWGGGGIQGYLKQWRATANGLESVASSHCDALLCLDEISQVSGKEAGDIAYMLANGAGKSRARKDGSGRPPAEWRILFLSTGEMSLSDKMEEAHRRSWAGQEVRVVDIPSEAGKQLGVFEELHGERDGHAFARYLREVTDNFYGVASREFLERLISDLEVLTETGLKIRRQFVEENVLENADGQVKRVAARFALIAAAGELATVVGVLPWSKDEAINASARCFKDWLDNRGGTGAAEIAEGIAQIRLFFEQHGESRFTPWHGDNTDRPTIHRAGFRRGEDDKNEFFVFPEVYKKEMTQGFDTRILNPELIKRGYLLPDSAGRSTSAHRIPGIGIKRVYHFSPDILIGNKDERK